MLLDAGAKTSLPNADGKRPIDLIPDGDGAADIIRSMLAAVDKDGPLAEKIHGSPDIEAAFDAIVVHFLHYHLSRTLKPSATKVSVSNLLNNPRAMLLSPDGNAPDPLLLSWIHLPANNVSENIIVASRTENADFIDAMGRGELTTTVYMFYLKYKRLICV